MNKWYWHIIIAPVIMLVICGLSILQTAKIQNPGATGMKRQVDVDLLKDTDAYYLENGNVSLNPGMIKRRYGLYRESDSNVLISSGVGMYDYYNRTKKILATLKNESSSITICANEATRFIYSGDNYKGGGGACGEAIAINTDEYIGRITASDTFSWYVEDNKLTLNYSDPGALIGGDNYYHDYTKAILNQIPVVIHADGMGLPTVYVNWSLNPAGVPDSIIYSPRTISLSPPRPGQPMVRLVDCDCNTSLKGNYVYQYYLHPYGMNNILIPGPESMVLSPRNQCVTISSFVGQPMNWQDTSEWYDADMQSHNFVIFRKEYKALSGDYSVDYDTSQAGVDTSGWVCIGTIGTAWPDSSVLIDSGQTYGAYLSDNDPVTYDTIYNLGELTINDSSYTGAIEKIRKSVDSTDTMEMPYFQGTESDSVAVKWSYYDPITGIESGLSYGGIKSFSSILDTGDFGSASGHQYAMHTIWGIGRKTIPETPTQYVRIYRSIIDDSYAGADDTSVVYAVYHAPINSCIQDWEGSLFILGTVPDSMLGDGPVDFTKTGASYDSHDSGQWMGKSTDVDPYTNDNQTFSYDGEQVMRPPLVAPLEIPFKDMEYANGRLWGIGDPLFPQRLYYSGELESEGINDWNPNYYLNMDESENDELVAIERVESTEGDLMCLWKHNSVYLLGGYDPEYDAQIYRIADGYGAVNRFGVIKTPAGIFFMTNEHKIYAVAGGGKPEYISGGLQDYIDSTFIDSIDYKIRTMLLKDRVLFIQTHSTKERGISYNFNGGVFQVETWYNNVVPAGSFLYDTVQGTVGFRDFSYWIYENEPDSSYLWTEYSGSSDSLNDTTEYWFPLKYQTPFIGDGNYVYAIDRVHFVGQIDGDSAVIAEVRNDQDSIVAADTISLAMDVLRDYDFTFPDHYGKHLSVHISGNGLIKINDVTIEYRKVGVADVR